MGEVKSLLKGDYNTKGCSGNVLGIEFCMEENSLICHNNDAYIILKGGRKYVFIRQNVAQPKYDTNIERLTGEEAKYIYDILYPIKHIGTEHTAGSVEYYVKMIDKYLEDITMDIDNKCRFVLITNIRSKS